MTHPYLSAPGSRRPPLSKREGMLGLLSKLHLQGDEIASGLAVEFTAELALELSTDSVSVTANASQSKNGGGIAKSIPFPQLLGIYEC